MLKALDWPPVWTLAHMALAYAAAAAWSFELTELRLTGVLIMALAILLAAFAAFTLWRAGTTVVPGREPSALVTGGPYRLSRNPIYLADVLVLGGWCLALGQPLAAVLMWPLFRVLDTRFAAPEERRLAATFGAAFLAYARRVRRWL